MTAGGYEANKSGPHGLLEREEAQPGSMVTTGILNKSMQKLKDFRNENAHSLENKGQCLENVAANLMK
jgi:hypothetical protein